MPRASYLPLEQTSEPSARGRCWLPSDLSPRLDREFTEEELKFWKTRCEQRADEAREDLRRAGQLYRIRLGAI